MQTQRRSMELIDEPRATDLLPQPSAVAIGDCPAAAELLNKARYLGRVQLLPSGLVVFPEHLTTVFTNRLIGCPFLGGTMFARPLRCKSRSKETRNGRDREVCS